MRKLNIGVLFGGRSSEHDVSLLSAEHVIEALPSEKYNVIQIGITKEGHWVSHGAKTLAMLQKGRTLPSSAVLLPEPRAHGIVSLTAKTHAGAVPIDVFFPVLHGTYGEDGSIQGLFELADIPYVGCGVLASSLGMDKVAQKQLLQYHRIPVVAYLFFYRSTWDSNRHGTVERIEDVLHYPVFVKPARLGSSVGISKAANHVQLLKAIRDALIYDEKIIVEEGITGVREFECALVGNDTPKVSTIGEIITPRPFYDYHAKYFDRRTQRSIPADIPKHLAQQIQSYATDVFHAIEGRGMSRVDFFYHPKSDALYVNEINTIPALNVGGSFAQLWEEDGFAFPEVLDRLIELAIDRHSKMRRIQRSFTKKSKRSSAHAR